MKFIFKLLFVSSFCIFNTCFLIDIGDGRVNFDKDTFNREYTAWKELNIKNYQYVQKALYDVDDANARYWWTTTVKNGATISMELDGDYGDYKNTLLKEYVLTDEYRNIDGIFEYVLKYYKGHAAKARIDENNNILDIEIKYNAKYHYPEYVDYRFYGAGSSGIIDHILFRFVIDTRDFQIIP